MLQRHKWDTHHKYKQYPLFDRISAASTVSDNLLYQCDQEEKVVWVDWNDQLCFYNREISQSVEWFLYGTGVSVALGNFHDNSPIFFHVATFLYHIFISPSQIIKGIIICARILPYESIFPSYQIPLFIYLYAKYQLYRTEDIPRVKKARKILNTYPILPEQYTQNCEISYKDRDIQENNHYMARRVQAAGTDLLSGDLCRKYR